jgi:broad specificity phosphatase PhoE
MRIGLLRHFPVEQKLPSGWKTAAELNDWRERYDLAKTLPCDFDSGHIDWQECIASDLPRARLTACAVFKGPVEHTSLLREPEFAQFKTGRLRLPVLAWRCVLQLSWMFGHDSQRACRDEFLGRVNRIADQLCGRDKNVLVVSHAGIMAYLSRELCRRGFSGPKLKIARHAKAYIYERS